MHGLLRKYVRRRKEMTNLQESSAQRSYQSTDAGETDIGDAFSGKKRRGI